LRIQQVIRKSLVLKIFKSSKDLLIKSALGLMSGLVLFGIFQSTIVKAETATNPITTGETAEQPNNENIPDNPGEVLYSGTWGADWEITDLGGKNGVTLHIKKGEVNDLKDTSIDESPWTKEERDKVKTIWIDKGIKTGVNSSGLFKDFPNVEMVRAEGVDTSATTDFSYLFADCSSLTSIDIRQWDLANVSNFSHMAAGDSKLTELFLPDGMASGVEDRSTIDFTSMFENNTNLQKLDLSQIDMSGTDKVADILKGDTSLNNLTLSPKNNLTESGLSVGERNKIEIEHGYTGWQVSETTDDSYVVDDAKITADLIGEYIGKTDGNGKTTWINYEPYICQFIEMDKNGKKSYPVTVKLPVEYTGITNDMYQSQLDGLSNSDNIVIYYDEDKEIGSFDKETSSDGETYKYPITQEYIDAMGDTGRGFASRFLDALTSDKILYSDSGHQATVSFMYDTVFPDDSNSGGSSSGGSSSSSNRKVEGIEETLSTYTNNPDVKLYDDNGSLITDRALAPASDWYTDQLMTLKGVKYYRVATNEWAKADDVYLYYQRDANVLVNADKIGTMVKDSGKDVTDRALQTSSGWYSDRYIYINDVKHYRVATNEFVSADKVQEY